MAKSNIFENVFQFFTHVLIIYLHYKWSNDFYSGLWYFERILYTNTWGIFDSDLSAKIVYWEYNLQTIIENMSLIIKAKK